MTFRNATYRVLKGLFLRGNIPVNGPLWFLLSLFGVRFMSNLFLPNKVDKYYWAKIVIIVLIGYLISYLSYLWSHRLLPLWIANSSAGLVFFTLGYAIRDYEDKLWIIIPSVIIYLLCCLLGFPIVDMYSNNLSSGSYFLWIPVAFICIIAINGICRYASRYIRIKPIEIVGRNAMPIFLSHMLICSLVEFCLKYFKLKCIYSYSLYVIIGFYAVFLPIICCLYNNRRKLCENS